MIMPDLVIELVIYQNVHSNLLVKLTRQLSKFHSNFNLDDLSPRATKIRTDIFDIVVN